MKYDCVVIGSGVSGLAAASVLAHQGQRVALVEKHDTLSPLLRRFRKNGKLCDTGFHYSGCLGDSELLPAFFRYLGIENYLKRFPMDPERYDVLRMGDEAEYELPSGWGSLEEYLIRRFPDSAAAVEAYLRKTRALISETSYLNLDLPWGSYSEIERDHRSLRQFLEAHGAEPSLINLLGCHGFQLHGSPESEVPFVTHAYVMGTFYEAVSMLERGGDAILDGFHAYLEGAGVDLLPGDGVRTIEIDSNRNVTGVITTGGARLACDQCICTTHPAALAGMLPDSKATSRFRKRLSGMVNTFGALIVYCDIDSDLADFKRKNHYFIRGNGGDADTRSGMAVMATGADGGPGGGKNVTIMRYMPPDDCRRGIEEYRSADYFAAKERAARETVDDLIKCFPNFSGRVTVAAAATPATMHRYTGTENGAIYGTMKSIRQPQLMARTSVRGLTMAGQSILPGVIGAILSGMMAVFEIIDGKSIWEQVRACRQGK